MLVVGIIFIAPFAHAQILPRGFQEETVAYGLREPTAAEYAPDGRLFICEKQGRIRILKDGHLLKTPFMTVKVNGLYERGLVGFAFDPDFTHNSYIYIYRTTSATHPQNVVERYTANGDTVRPESKKLLLNGIHSDAGIHNAGCLRFGRDGKLYISTGDGGEHSEYAQDLSNLNGKILRINPDGSIPPDNPFVNQPGARAEIWCYGFRNPWRFAIHPVTGLLIIGDVGADTYEELNVGKAGANYGWPVAEGPSTNPAFTNPVYSYDHTNGGAAVTVGNFYTMTKYPPKYRDRLFVTDYARNFIKVFSFDDSGNLLHVQNFADKIDSPVHMLQSPEGAMLVVSIHTGEIRRIRYVGGQNRPPLVYAKSSTRAGLKPFKVNFSSKGTFDPDGDPITYAWDFGDGQTSAEANPSHTYTENGTYYALFTVRDNKGGSSSARSIRIVVGNLPPEVTILKPADGTVVRLGDVVYFSGKAIDPEDGPVDPNNMKWSAKLFHNDHTHPVLSGVRGTSGSFPILFHDTGKIFYRLYLHATDSDGLGSAAHVDLPLAQ
jgi:glucose/arabinose dehydrogenase